MHLVKGCTPQTRKCSPSKWPVFGDNPKKKIKGFKVMPQCCVQHLRQILHYLHDLFEEKEIKYWMDFGTLLGAVRGGRNIEHDTDGDLCLMLEDRKRILQLDRRMANDGFCMACYKPKRRNDTHIKICRSKTNRMVVDLFFWNDKKLTGILSSPGLNEPKSFPDYFTKRLVLIDMFGKPMWAPQDTERFLRYRFGKDWKKPQDKKVHFQDAEKTHAPAFAYAKSKGWRKKIEMT